MARIRRYLLLAAFACLFAAAQAMSFDESLVDFSNTGTKVLYVVLDHDAGGLRVSLAPERVAGAVSTISVRKLEPAVGASTLAHLYGSRPWAGRAFAAVLRLDHAGGSYRQITLFYRRDPPAIAGVYLRRLRALHYTVAVEPVTGNITVYRAQQGNETLRIVIVRQGIHSRVTIAQITPP